MNETTLTIVGNLTHDPELRYTPNGAAVANFTIASTPRTYDKAAGDWRDGATLFMRCAAWRDLAENVAESLHRGTRVIVTGRLNPQEWDDKQTGEKRRGLTLDVDEVGPSLRYATAAVTRTPRGQGGQGNTGQGRTADRSQGWATDQPDPWSTPATGGSSGGQPGPYGTDEPPF